MNATSVALVEVAQPERMNLVRARVTAGVAPETEEGHHVSQRAKFGRCA